MLQTSEPSSSSADEPSAEGQFRSTIDDVCSGSARADVVIVAYETPELLDRCLASLMCSSIDDDHRVGRIVVVDNSESDHCVQVVRRRESVELLRPPLNLGFGRGVNLGLAATRGGADFVLVLNADTEVRPGAVGALVDHLLAHPVAAMAGPSLTDVHGGVQASCGTFPTPIRVLLGQTGLWRPAVRMTGRQDLRPLHNPTSSGPVPWVLGAALMLDRRAVEEVGGFDPGFHMYFEEVDLARRLSALRRETHFVAEAAVRHVGGASTSRRAGEMEREMYASLARHVRLHGGSTQLRRLRIAVMAVAGARLLQSVATAAERSTWRLVMSDAAHGWPA